MVPLGGHRGRLHAKVTVVRLLPSATAAVELTECERQRMKAEAAAVESGPSTKSKWRRLFVLSDPQLFHQLSSFQPK